MISTSYFAVICWMADTYCCLIAAIRFFSNAGETFLCIVPFFHYACIKDADAVTSDVENCVLIKT